VCVRVLARVIAFPSLNEAGRTHISRGKMGARAMGGRVSLAGWAVLTCEREG